MGQATSKQAVPPDLSGVIVFPCSTCGGALRSPAAMLGKRGRCHICGSEVVVASQAAPTHHVAARSEQTAGPALNGRHAPKSRAWRLLIGAALLPPVFLTALSLWVFTGEGLFAQRISILNQVFVALYAYCVLAGGYNPNVIGGLLGIDLDRKQVLTWFLPALLVTAALAVLTFRS